MYVISTNHVAIITIALIAIIDHTLFEETIKKGKVNIIVNRESKMI